MRVTLVALNAQYVHTSLALRLLSQAAVGLPIAHTSLELHINQHFEDQLRQIAATQPQVVAFSCAIWNIEGVLRLARGLKKLVPGLFILLGGPEVSYNPAQRLAENTQVDAVLCGEGERTYPMLLSALEAGESLADIPGLCMRGTENPWAPMLDAVQWVEPYPGERLDPHRIYYAETARGCPFRCQFCLSAGGKGVVALPTASAVDRLTALARAGAKLVKLVDRTFNFDPDRARAIFSALKDMQTDCVFHFEIEPSLLDEATLSLLETVPRGRFQFEIGVQTTHPEALVHIQRRLDYPRLAQAMARLKAKGNIPLHLDLIAGLPGEDWAGFARSFDAVYALAPDRLQLGFLKLLHGSGLRARAETLGLVYCDDPPYEVLSTPQMGYVELGMLKDVARLLDVCGNSGRFPCSMRLLTLGRSAFEAFCRLACALRDKGAWDVPMKPARFLAALYEAGPQVPGIESTAWADALRFDALRGGLHPTALPEALAEPYDQAQENAQYLRQRLPRPAERRRCCVAFFDLDVVRLMEKGQRGQGPVRLLIDGTTGHYEPLGR